MRRLPSIFFRAPPAVRLKTWRPGGAGRGSLGKLKLAPGRKFRPGGRETAAKRRPARPSAGITINVLLL